MAILAGIKIAGGMPAISDKSERQPIPTSPDRPESTATAQSIRSLELQGTAGRLEALLNEGRQDSEFVSLVCHPHPLGGGTMHNKVVYHAAKVFQGFGWPVLRFNFRSTGLSEGEHHGSAEADDVRTALDWLTLHYNKPIIVAGFSFGAAMGLAACCGNPDIRAFAALGLPTEAQGRRYSYPMLPDCTIPKLFLSGGRDQFAPTAQLEATVATAADPKQLILIPGTDHFFTGSLPDMQEALRNWLEISLSVFFPDSQPQAPGSPSDNRMSEDGF
jgi:hypothetical protein